MCKIDMMKYERHKKLTETTVSAFLLLNDIFPDRE